MAYNLPPPWDPGYALPQNVRDEGLERHAFVTKQMPRGTYDMPDVGTGGYAVPEYVMREGYGQGTFTTKWEPRGQYDGPAVPHWLNRRPQVAVRGNARGREVLTVRAPVIVKQVNAGAVAMHGDAPLPAVFRNYGERAADMLIAQIARVPKERRTAVLKDILGRVDKTLWKRSRDIARELVAQGASPGQAFREGLARAMSAGIAAEIIRVGQTRTAPQPRSLLGLGCYGCAAALGADTMTAAFFQPAPTTQIAFVQQPLPPKEGDCSADQLYIFKSGTWTRRSAGQPCGAVTTMTGEVRTGQGGGVTVSGPSLLIGQFVFPLAANGEATEGQRISWNSTNKLSLGRQKYLAERFDTLGKFSIYGHLGFVSVDGATIGQPGVQVSVPRSLTSGHLPIGGALNPATRQHWAMYLADIDKDGPGSGAVVIKKYTPSTGTGPVDAVVGAVGSFLGGAAGLVGDALSKLGGLACGLLNNPGAVQGGAAAGGAPGAMGVSIAQNTMCKPTGQSLPPPGGAAPPPDSGFGNILPLALLAGGGLLAVVLLTGKKNSSST